MSKILPPRKLEKSRGEEVRLRSCEAAVLQACQGIRVTRSRGQAQWPSWWDWDLELTPHVERRMEDRDFSEVDLRDMLHQASALTEDVVLGRYIAVSRLRGRNWEIILEPDPDVELVVAVTAYPVEKER